MRQEDLPEILKLMERWDEVRFAMSRVETSQASTLSQRVDMATHAVSAFDTALRAYATISARESSDAPA